MASTGFGGTISSAEKEAASYAENEELLWAEGYYRGYYELHISHEQAEARYFGGLSLCSYYFFGVILTVVADAPFNSPRLSDHRVPKRLGHTPGQLHDQGRREPSFSARGRGAREVGVYSRWGFAALEPDSGHGQG